MKVKSLCLLLALGGVVTVSSTASAVVFTGSAIGSWHSPHTTVGGDVYGVVNNDDGPAMEDDQALFWWGDPYTGDSEYDTGTTRNEFNFNGIGSNWDESAGTGTPGYMDTSISNRFLLGKFSYYNGSTWLSDGLDGVQLNVDIYISELGSIFKLNSTFSITNTPNDSEDPDYTGNSDDIVTLTGGNISERFSYGGQMYQFDIIGFSQDGGANVANFLPSPEDTTAYAGLYAEIRPVPEPATLLLFSIGLAGLVGINRRRSGK